MKTKTRSASELGSCSGGYYYPGSGGYLGKGEDPLSEGPMRRFHMEYQKLATAFRPAPELLTNFRGSERIVYGTRSRPTFNYCKHEKAVAVMHPFSVVKISPHYPHIWGLPYRLTPWTHSYDAITAFPDPGICADNSVGFSNRAWWTMQPRFEGRISTVNAIYELKDFKHAAKSMAGLMKHGSASSLIREFKRNFADSSRLTRRGRGKAAPPRNPVANYDPSAISANMLLTYNMAIRPLVSDFIAILSNLATTVAQAQNEFTDLGKQVQSSHYTEVLDEQGSYVPKSLNLLPYFEEGIKFRATRTATLTYTYKYRRRNSSEAFLKYWGLQATPEALWNALPGSFLLDYFIGIADSLHAMNIDKHVDVHEHQYCESVSKRQMQGLWFSGSPSTRVGAIIGASYCDESSSDVLITGINQEKYLRTPCAPHYGIYVPKPKKVTDMHMLNMAALARVFF